MSSIDDQPAPGTTLNHLIEQDHFLREFLELVRKRFRFEREHARKLQNLRASANPKWTNSAIWPIVSPFLILLDQEVKLREDISDSIFAKLSKIPKFRPPNEPDKEGVTPTAKYAKLRLCYDEYTIRFKEINTVGCIDSLQAWYRQEKNVDSLQFMSPSDIEAYQFPEADRKYRDSVLNQKQSLSIACQWHKEILPESLEAHQERVEDIKSTLNHVAMEFSRSISRFVQIFSAMTNNTARISSSQYIAPLHSMQEAESEHILMNPVEYRNFYTDGRPAQPVFGTSLSVSYVDWMLKKEKWAETWQPLSIENAFNLEKAAMDRSSIQSFLDFQDADLSEYLTVTTFLSIPPPVPLPDGISARYGEKWTRSKLMTLMKSIPEEGKRYMAQWPKARQRLEFAHIAMLWCHDPGAEYLVAAICRKWDFDNDSPLPDALERLCSYRKLPHLVWKKTLEPYVPPV